MKQRALSSDVIAGLDAARAFAAIYVVIHHVASARGLSHSWGLIFRFGQEAVLVFFLLSGFVMFANERDRACRPGGYCLRRLRRIYPPLIAAMIVSTLVALDNGDLTQGYSTAELLGTLFGLQDISFLKPGVIVDPYLGNDPLWSLSYELGFYALFPLVLVAWRRWPVVTNHLVGLICCLCYMGFALRPNHFALVGAYFLLWWCGAMTADAYLRGGRTVRAIGGVIVWLAILCLVAGLVAIGQGRGRGIGYYPWLPVRHFAFGLAVLLVFFGPFGATLSRLTVSRKRLFAAGASISYGLYVLHYPLLVDWNVARSAIGLTTAFVILLLLAWLVERQLPRFLPRAPSS